jgi:hypothetical protein
MSKAYDSSRTARNGAEAAGLAGHDIRGSDRDSEPSRVGALLSAAALTAQRSVEAGLRSPA